MPDIRRTIMNTFKDAQECQMFVMILKQKWSEFDGKLKDKLTVEIATDVASPCKHTAYLTAQSVQDFKIVDDGQKKRYCHFLTSLLQRAIIYLRTGCSF